MISWPNVAWIFLAACIVSGPMLPAQEKPQEEKPSAVTFEIVPNRGFEVIAVEGQKKRVRVLAGPEPEVGNGSFYDRLWRQFLIEVAFLRRACQLTEEQNRLMIALDESWLKRNTAKQLSANVKRTNQYNSTAAMADLACAILNDAATKILDSTQMAQYLSEKESQTAFIRKASEDFVLLLLDQQLVLNDQQHQAIRQSLKTIDLNLFQLQQMAPNQSLPSLPDNLIKPHLSPEQVVAYDKIRKIQIALGEEHALPVIDR